MNSDQNKRLIDVATNGDFDEVRRLVEAGADVNAGGVPAFLKAYFQGHINIVKYLYDNGADVHYDGFLEVTPLMSATIRDDVEFMAYLISRGASVDQSLPAGGETALHKAAIQNRANAARFLIEQGANVNHRTKDGGKTEMRHFGTVRQETPLHIAAVRGEEELIQILLDAGADKTAQTSHGKIPYDYAVEHDRPKGVINLLAV